MKTLEDKLREISLDELNEWTIQKISQVQSMYQTREVSKPSKEEHTKRSKKAGSIGGKSTSKKKVESARKNLDNARKMVSHESAIARGKKGGPKGGKRTYELGSGIHDPKVREKTNELIRILQNTLNTCEHCGYQTNGAAINISHNDKCFMKNLDKTSFLKRLDTESVLSLTKEFGISYTTLSRYKKFINKNN